MQYYESVVDLIGNTPLVKLGSVARDVPGIDRMLDPKAERGAVGQARLVGEAKVQLTPR